jgi:hypothetical protein
MKLCLGKDRERRSFRNQAQHSRRLMTRAACSRLATEIQHEIRSTPREVKFGVHVEVSKAVLCMIICTHTLRSLQSLSVVKHEWSLVPVATTPPSMPAISTLANPQAHRRDRHHLSANHTLPWDLIES